MRETTSAEPSRLCARPHYGAGLAGFPSALGSYPVYDDGSPSHPRILLADDNDLNREIVVSLLRAAHIDVDVVGDGEAACRAIAIADYDLVLMDIDMPILNGFEATVRIRDMDCPAAGIAIVALTAMDQNDARNIHEASGMDAFIGRPVKARAFVQRVSQLIAEAGQRSVLAQEAVVWNSETFATLCGRLGIDRMKSYLVAFKAHLGDMADILAQGDATSNDFWQRLHDLVSVSGILGFEETLFICRDIQDMRCRGVRRDRLGGLAGAINRAVASIDGFLSRDNDD